MINHFQLYQTLMKQRVSVAFLNIIINWYSKLSIVVRWNTMFSDTLRVRSGVRQGGVCHQVCSTFTQICLSIMS